MIAARKTRLRLAAIAAAAFALCTATQAYAQEAQVRGVLKASKVATLASETGARILDRPYSVGDAVEAGAVIVSFDCRRIEAEKKAAIAEQRSAHSELKQQRTLKSYGATGAMDVQLAEAKAAAANARLEAIDAEKSTCEITAPFAGRVSDVYAYPHETVSAGQEILTLIGSQDLEIDLIVPSIWLRWLRPGEPFTFVIDETGTAHTAQVLRVGARVDPVSQTIQVIAQLVEQPELVLSGMSGVANFDMPLADTGEISGQGGAAQ
ncbi:MAG: efflux RND transporter periplasmic adaptor subunit [Neomegalonema sp.]|nr:efflux RND transporter periplasmic adaptor subunit [Neomegalonema sp.]